MEAVKVITDLDKLALALAEVDRLNVIIKFKNEEIRLLNIRFFGPKADKLSSGQIDLLFGEALVTAAEVEKEAGLPEEKKQNLLPQAREPRPNHRGRNPLPAHLERREEIIACSPGQCHCNKCGAKLPVIGYEIREELGCVPAEFFVRVTKREKRGSHCLEEQGVTTAAVPAQIVPKSKLSNEFIIQALAQKFQQHQPVYRQCATLLENHGIELSRTTLTDAILAAGALLQPVVKAMAVELVSGSYIQTDETSVPCQTPEKTGKNHTAFIWEYSRPGGVVVFVFGMGRGREGPLEFLKNFRGKLQSDGYGVYNKLGDYIVYVGCLAHARRKFVDAGKLALEDPLPREVVAIFAELYAVEREAREKSLGVEERLALRQEKSAPVMERLKKRIVEIRTALSPASQMAKACDYTLGQWTRLEEYLKDGLVEIDNNWCEGAIRPLALGRKNWLHIGSEQAGPKVTAIASIVETCRRLEINLVKYLSDVLPKIADWKMSRVAELTPAAWKADQKS
jgi:transposase